MSGILRTKPRVTVLRKEVGEVGEEKGEIREVGVGKIKEKEEEKEVKKRGEIKSKQIVVCIIPCCVYFIRGVPNRFVVVPVLHSHKTT